MKIASKIELFKVWSIDIKVNLTFFKKIFCEKKILCKSNDERTIDLIILGKFSKEEMCLYFNFLGSKNISYVSKKFGLSKNDIPVNLFINKKSILSSLLEKNKNNLIKEINFYIKGTNNDYYIYMDAILNDVCNSLVKIFINGYGNVNNFNISNFKMYMLNGCVDLFGKIDWKNQVSFCTSIKLNNINFFLKNNFRYPLKLSGIFFVKGVLDIFGKWSLQISKIHFEGNFIKYPIIFFGSLSRDFSGEWDVSKFFMKVGSNILKISGNSRKNKSINIILKIKNFNEIKPGLHGRVEGLFKIYKNSGFFQLSSVINVFFLFDKTKNWKIDQICFDSNLKFSKKIVGNILCQLNQVNYNVLTLKKVIFRGFSDSDSDSDSDRLNFDLIIDDSKLSSKMKFLGNFNIFDQVWSFKLKKMDIFTKLGILELMQDIIIKYDKKRKKITVSPHIWKSENFSVSSLKELKVEKIKKLRSIFDNWNLISLRDLPLSDIKVFGRFVCYIKCSWTLDKSLFEGEILFLGKKIKIQYFLKSIETLTEIDNCTLQFLYDKKFYYYEWLIVGNNDFQSHGNFKVFLSKDLFFKIVGNVKIINGSLHFFNLFFDLDKLLVYGRGNCCLSFSGFLCNPKIYGSIEFVNLDIHQSYISCWVMRNNRVFIKFFGDYAILDGLFDTECGKFFLRGNVYNFNSIKNIIFSLKIYNNDLFSIEIPPKIKVKIFANVSCTITHEKISVFGKIEIPQGSFKIQEFSNNDVMTKISSEEIILDDSYQLSMKKNKIFSIPVIDLNVSVKLGHDVSLIGSQLNATSVQGDLNIKYMKNNFIITGSANILSGYFHIYNRDLIIKRGQLLFFGSIDRPYFDIEAVQEFDSKNKSDILGVRITGNVGKPKLEFFSNLLYLSQKEIILLLLNGDDVRCDVNQNLMSSLLIGAVGRTFYNEKFFNKVGDYLKVKNLSLDIKGFGSLSQIILSGYVAPGFQVKYGINVSNFLVTVSLRYCCFSKFYLEAMSSGLIQEFDFLYKFNF